MAEIQFKEIRLTVPWGYVAARTYGSSTGEPVLMVHGLQDNAGSFTRLMKYLPMDLFYYVCLDLPGHGWSSHLPSWQYLDLLDYAHMLYFILEALQWKTCIYVGHSFGARIGIIFSVFQPDKIKKIISFDSFLVDINTVEDYFITYVKNASALSIKASSNIKPVSYTKEQILHAFKTKRQLNSEAADALFERAVTEVNGKYIYNSDIRLKNSFSFSFMNESEFCSFNHNISVPLYVISTSHGLTQLHHKKFMSACKEVNPKILKIINVEGNHEFHINNPKEAALHVCKILNDSSSKL